MLPRDLVDVQASQGSWVLIEIKSWHVDLPQLVCQRSSNVRPEKRLSGDVNLDHDGHDFDCVVEYSSLLSGVLPHTLIVKIIFFKLLLTTFCLAHMIY